VRLQPSLIIVTRTLRGQAEQEEDRISGPALTLWSAALSRMCNSHVTRTGSRLQAYFRHLTRNHPVTHNPADYPLLPVYPPARTAAYGRRFH